MRSLLIGTVSTSAHVGSAEEHRQLFMAVKPKQLSEMKTPWSSQDTENNGHYTCALIHLLFFWFVWKPLILSLSSPYCHFHFFSFHSQFKPDLKSLEGEPDPRTAIDLKGIKFLPISLCPLSAALFCIKSLLGTTSLDFCYVFLNFFFLEKKWKKAVTLKWIHKTINNDKNNILTVMNDHTLIFLLRQ